MTKKTSFVSFAPVGRHLKLIEAKFQDDVLQKWDLEYFLSFWCLS